LFSFFPPQTTEKVSLLQGDFRKIYSGKLKQDALAYTPPIFLLAPCLSLWIELKDYSIFYTISQNQNYFKKKLYFFCLTG